MKKALFNSMRLFAVVFALVMTNATAHAEGWDQQVYDAIMSRIKAPVFKSKYYSITAGVLLTLQDS